MLCAIVKFAHDIHMSGMGSCLYDHVHDYFVQVRGAGVSEEFVIPPQRWHIQACLADDLIVIGGFAAVAIEDLLRRYSWWDIPRLRAWRNQDCIGFVKENLSKPEALDVMCEVMDEPGW